MAFEVEKRSKVSLQEFRRVKKFLRKNSRYLGRERMISFLFNEPTYLRIRIIKGKNKAVLTYKSGSYKHKARKELDKEINKSELKKLIVILKNVGYKKCVSKKTERESYKFNGLKVELNKIESLGLIIEIEAITNKKSEISRLNKKIEETMKFLKLKELHYSVYQKMLNKIYSKSKAIEKHDFMV